MEEKMVSFQSAERYKTWDVTFQEVKKYNPITRTVQVESPTEYSAKLLVGSMFGSLKKGKDIKTMLLPEVSEKKIKILKIKEVKEESTNN